LIEAGWGTSTTNPGYIKTYYTILDNDSNNYHIIMWEEVRNGNFLIATKTTERNY